MALETTKGYRAKCVINDLNLVEINKELESIKLAINIYAYLMPLKQILKQIKQVTKADNILVQIIIDNLSNFHPGSEFDLYSRYFLDLIEKECNSTKVNFKLTWTMMDSKKSIGIQITDLICGAYRKEIKYRKFQPDIKLIPFKYLKFHENEKILENRDFLQVYALVNLLPKPQPKKEETPVPVVPEEGISVPKLYILHDFAKLKKAIREIDEFLISSLQRPFEHKVLICDLLHQYFNQIFRETNRYLSLKQKYTKDKDCIAVINNFRKNLIALGRMINNNQIGNGDSEYHALRKCFYELQSI